MADIKTEPHGLCADCVHGRVVESARGSRFILCGKSETDPAFARYPQLPVAICGGYQKKRRGEEE